MTRETTLTPQMAEQAAARLGLAGPVELLASERDLTYRLLSGGHGYVLKICHAEEAPWVVAFQLGALRHLAQRAPGVPVPRVLAHARLGYEDGLERETYVLSWLDGALLSRHRGGRAQAAALGTVMARMCRALEDLPPPPAPPAQLWDVAQALQIRPLLAEIEPGPARLAGAVLDEFEARIKPVLDALPRQVIHNDCNPHNVFVDPAAPARITGIIDFGDLTVAPRMCDLAVGLSYQMQTAELRATIPAWLAAYEAVAPLHPGERAVLAGLIRTRMAMTVAISSWRAARAPENAAYLLRYRAGAMACLEAGDGIFAGVFGDE
ncbi:phosphotransferase [Acidocella sp.]|uniref:phosphotransferase n=1 Tax=Acidocella sp. TaxID=50710 RepID=UPI002612249C|nr:phosphotransferase [Acidocella sp.]